MAPKKHKKKRPLRNKLIAALLSIVIIFAALFTAAETFGSVPLSNAADAFGSLSAGGSFPYKIDSTAVENVVAMGNGLAVLKSDTLDILGKSGELLQSYRHNYQDPGISISNGRAVLFDRGGTRYTVLSRTAVLLGERQTEDKILCASLSEDGKLAVAVASNDVKSELSVYNTSFSEVFRFRCVSEYITDIDFSSNGKKFAVSAAGVKNAAPYSRILHFELGSEEPLAQMEFDGVLFFDIGVSGAYTTAVSDTYICTLKNGSEKVQESTLKGDIMQYYCTEESGKNAMVLLTYGNERASKLCTVDRRGELNFETVISGKTRAVSRSSSYTCVLTEYGVATYRNNGVLVKELMPDEAITDICVSGRTLYVLYTDRIERYSAA